VSGSCIPDGHDSREKENRSSWRSSFLLCRHSERGVSAENPSSDFGFDQQASIDRKARPPLQSGFSL
jgi:hypothetical protein